jgi:hypothetical protein
VPGWNALVLQTDSPGEFVRHLERLRAHPAELRAVRRRGAQTARRYAWAEIIARSLLPHLDVLVGRHEAAGSTIPAEAKSARRRSSIAAPEAA